MRFPLVVSCACFVASFGLARWASTPAKPLTVEVTGKGDIRPADENLSPPAEPPENESKPNPPRENFAQTLEGDDPLASASMALAWLDSATLNDLEKLVEAPEKTLWPRLSKLNKDLRIAIYEAIAARWLDLDPESGIAGFRKLQKSEPLIYYSEVGELLASAARVRPEAFLRTTLQSGKSDPDYYQCTAFEALARRDPEAARQFLDQISTPEARRKAEVQIARGVVGTNPLAAVSLVRQFDDRTLYNTALEAAERIGPGIVKQLVSAAGGDLDSHPEIPRLLLKDPDLAGSITGSVTDKYTKVSPQSYLQSADRLEPAERQRLLDSYDSLPPGSRDTLAAAVACSWARTEPAKAAEWAFAHAQPNDRNNLANRSADLVFLRWVNNDPEEALAWWQSLPPSPLRDALGSNASTYIAENGQLDLALSMCRPQAGEADAMIAAQLVQNIVERDPAEAAGWIKGLPPDLDTSKAAELVISKWYARDAEAVARWVESLPAGSRRDGALTAFVKTATGQNPRGAAEWVETVSDPKLRQKAAETVYFEMRRSNPAEARSWLSELKGVDPEWHARVLRRWK